MRNVKIWISLCTVIGGCDIMDHFEYLYWLLYAVSIILI